MQKITPFLWYDKEAKQASEFYVSIFENSKIKNIDLIQNTPSGTVEIITLDLMNQEFSLMSAGPYFKFTPAISFTVSLSKIEEIDRLWSKLSDGGKILDGYKINMDFHGN